ncbi:hypothetical protein GCK72_005970 [Caenorhabditis remanei]|uniref:Uncharacterized protein n=1 Tax=Caenorhabditis remanei TaxID=31234 RepID=A0A6A5HF47_CAERE|nr:hypothetical protein GCK72_005970 [Caenorhabditis remanei]KAF1766015.1 hypothetical protein GCK72_005970 [Caenorhabditis remanei]
MTCFINFLSICFALVFCIVNSESQLTGFRTVNLQLNALEESLINMKVFQFQQLFDGTKLDMDTIFQPNFLFPNNVFASMGDLEFKKSLKIFTLFEPTITMNGTIQDLVTITYRMGGRENKMEKEVKIVKNVQSPTGYVFTAFKSV